MAARAGGFTIVELLFVIVVIAILAEITIVAHNDSARRAIESSMESNLQGTASELELDHASSGAYPTDPSSLNGGTGLHSSNGTNLTYVLKPCGYCLVASNPTTPTAMTRGAPEGR
jgi:type IV pilus assembly protein PilA